MRPKSVLKSKLQLQSRVKDKKDKKQPTRYRDLMSKTDPLVSSTSRDKVKSPKVHPSHSLANTKVQMVKSIRTLGMVHAYKPSHLRSCMVKNSKTYTNFFTSDGSCGSNQIFFKSVITHFRQWRKQLQERMLEVFDVIMAADQLIQTQFQDQIVNELTSLRQYGEKLRSGIESILQSGTYKTQVVKLSDNYQLLYKSLIHIISLIKNIFAFTKQITLFIEDRQDIDLNDLNAISEEMNKIRYNYEQKIKQSLNFCACHPDNRLLMKIQFFTRQKLAFCIRNALNIFDSLKEMQSFEKVFRQKLTVLLRSQIFDCSYLQGVIEFLYFKNQQIKLNQQKFQLNKRVQEKVSLLRSQIEAEETEFIRKFRSRCLKDTVDSARIIGKLQFLHLVKSKGKQYVDLKKKWLLMIKVFQESQKQSGIDEKIYNLEKKAVQQMIKALSESVKSVSSSIQTISQKMQFFQTFNKSHPEKNIKLVQKYKDQIRVVEQAQVTIDSVAGALVQELCTIQIKPQQSVEMIPHDNYTVLEQLAKVLIYTRNEENSSQIFQLLNSPPSMLHTNFKDKRDDKIQYILKDFEKKKEAHLFFVKHNLEKGIAMNHTLREVNRAQLINYLFGQQFLFEFISNYQLVKNTVNLNCRICQRVEKIEINNVQFFILSSKVLEQYRLHINQEIKKLEKNKSKTIFNRYIVFLYEQCLLQSINLKYIHNLCKDDQNIMNREDYNKIVGNFVYLYENILSKNRKENSMFGQLCDQIYHKAVVVLKQNRAICEYKESAFTGHYYPSLVLLSEWLDLQFTVDYGQLFSEHAIKAKRSQMSTVFRGYIRKLEAFKQKKNTYKFISSDHWIWKDISHTIIQLRQFTFHEEYTELVGKVLRYLRVKKIQHSALFTNDQTLICLFPFNSEPYKASKMVFNLLHIRFEYLNKNPNIVETLTFDDSKDIPQEQINKIVENVFKLSNLGLKQQSGLEEQIFVQKIIDSDKLGKQPEEMVEQIMADMTEQLGEQVIGSQLPSENAIAFAIQQSIPEQGALTKKEEQAPQASEIVKPYKYWKITVLSNIALLRKCLLYRNNQFKSLQKNMDIEIICKINTAEGRTRLVSHIDQILEEANKSDFLKMLNLGCENTEGEQILIKFQDAVKRNDSDLRVKLMEVLDYFRFLRTCVYEKGRNKIEAISKEGQQQCFVDVELQENNYVYKLSKFDVDQLLLDIWKQIKNALGKGVTELPNNVETMVNNFIRNTNNQLLAVYRQAEEEVGVAFRLKSVNKKRMEDKIRVFLDKTLNNKIFLSQKVKITSVFQAIQYVDRLSQELNSLNVLEPFYTMKHNEKSIYVSEWNITNSDVAKCMLLDGEAPQLSGFIEEKQQITIIKREAVPEGILHQISKRNVIQFQAVYNNVFFNEETLEWEHEKEQRQKYVHKIDKYTPFLTLVQDPILQQIHLKKRLLTSQIQLVKEMTLLNQIFAKNKGAIKTYQSNRGMKYQNKNTSVKLTRAMEEKYLNRLYSLLRQSQIDCYKLIYKGSTIGLLPSLTVEAGISYLNIDCLDLANKKYFSVKEDQIVINKFSICIDNIVPDRGEDKEISEALKQYLDNSFIEVKTTKKVETYSCLDLLNERNQIQIQLQWPQKQINLNFYNENLTLSAKLQSHQYHYFSKIEPTIFQNNLNRKIIDITADIQKRRAAERDKREEEEAKKNELEKDIRKKDAERQLELTKIQNQRLRIRLENEKINIQIEGLANKRKMGESKLQEVKPQKVQAQKKPESNLDMFKGYETANVFGHIEEDNLSLSLVLSEGHSIKGKEGDIFIPNMKHGWKEKTILDYDITLSEHMQDNSDMKEAKHVQQKHKQLDRELKSQIK